jgi:Alginate lyase
MRIIFFLVPVLLCGWWSACAAEVPPGYFAAKPGALERARKKIVAGDLDCVKALKKLTNEADGLLTESPPSVTQKTNVPPSGDKHDYLTIATYFWPDPQKPAGRPYIRHDGKVNPETRSDGYDYKRINRLGSAAPTLALAYYFTGKEAYADTAAKWLRVWFLDPATRMNPNMNFAQAVPGLNAGRGTGILEGRNLVQAADAAQLLIGSRFWSAADQQALAAWLEKYFDWLLNSTPGHDEQAAKNNHGTWYDVQAVELALCLGHTNVARQILADAKEQRLARQIEPDGRQPLELARTAAFSYSVFNLQAFAMLATLGEHVGVDLWHFRTADGRDLRMAIQFLLPYFLDPKKPWPYQQIHGYDPDSLAEVIYQASLVLNDAALREAAIRSGDLAGKRVHLLFNQ